MFKLAPLGLEKNKIDKMGKFSPIRKKRWYKIPLLIIAVLIFALGGLFAYKIIRATKNVITENITGSAPALTGNIEPLKLKGEGDGRINILLLGIGGTEHEAPNLTDTIIVVSIDPQTKSVAMLSIPRDFYVNIPSYGYNRINAAYALGEEKDYQGGGAALSKEVISNILDLPIHYYIRLDFSGFKKIVDILGGVTLEVEEDINDYYYPNDREGYSPFYIKKGTHQMDGELALKYARSRKTSSDFDRSRRQQEVLVAIKNKAFSLETFANPKKITEIINTLGDHARTDLQLWEMERIFEMFKEINTDNIANKVLDDNEDGVLYSTRVNGMYVLKPKAGDFSEIRKITHELFIDAYIKEENAAIEVLNGTSKSAIATKVRDLLKSYGYSVIKVGFAESRDFKKCVIYDYVGNKPYTVQLLAKRFNADIKRQYLAQKPEGIDIKIIIGEDYLNK